MGGSDLDLQGHLAILTHKTAFNVALVHWSRPAKGYYMSQTCSCLPSELIGWWSQFVDSYNFGAILTLWNWFNLVVPAILVMLCGLSSLWCAFDWNWSYLGFLGIIWRTCGSKCRGACGGIFPTLCVEFCLVIIIFFVSVAPPTSINPTLFQPWWCFVYAVVYCSIK